MIPLCEPPTKTKASFSSTDSEVGLPGSKDGNSVVFHKDLDDFPSVMLPLRTHHFPHQGHKSACCKLYLLDGSAARHAHTEYIS